MQRASICVLTAAGTLGLASIAQADFAGQPILGPLAPGSVVSGTTLGAADDNDGFDSGIHIFDIWDGGDNVYLLNWPGGDLTVTLDSLNGSDNDLFVFTPGSLDSTGHGSTIGAHDVVTILGAGPGSYYINVDSTAFSEGPYQLSVNVPAPASALAVLGAGMFSLGRRRGPKR